MDSKVNSASAIPMPSTGWVNGIAATFKKHFKIIALGLFVLIGGVLGYLWWTRSSSADEYVTDKVSRGVIEVSVSATGTVQAVTTVQVGSQVSGTVSWLGADFKSQVSRGQVIARLDTALIQAQVDTARANLINAEAGVQASMTDITNQQANVEASKANDRANAAARDDAIALAKRNQQLRGVIPDRDIEASDNAAKIAVARYSQATSQIGQAQAQLQIAQSKLKQSQAGVQQAQAQLKQAQVNLDHAIITSPIDGVVVSRSVDVGQTVAASLSAPTLFTIANDLTSMQVLASIDEADVGQVKEGGKATFTVDAFPGQNFSGNIIQVRLNSQTLQNVVTYTAVINVANPELKLMPGMTANITIPVAHRDNVLRVPNAALRFKPDLTDQQQKDVQAKMDAWRQQQRQNGADSEPQPSESPASNAAPAKPSPEAGSSGEPRQRGQGRNRGGDQQSKSSDASAAANSNSESGSDRHRRRAGGEGADANSAQPGQEKPASSEGGNRKRGDRAKQATAEATPSPGSNQPPAESNRSGRVRQPIQVIWVLTANKTLEPHFARTGLTDGRFTEIIGSDLKEGDVIVIGQNSSSSSNNRPGTTSPFSQRPPGAGGGGRGGGR